ncbi:MAG: hypothetical protein HUU01_19215, partial [Saprospiraceae bacterium]|nr:hypothetical protein [Saprospiraceae bacterium]
VLTKIDFFDLNNKQRGSFDVKTNNPYKPETYKPFLSEAYMDVSRSIIDKGAHPDYDWHKNVRQYATWVSMEVNTECETVALGYFLQALGEDRTLLGILATFILLDNRGKEIARFENMEDIFFGQGLMTCDQKYFCLKYGGAFTENSEMMYNERLRIYDIQKKKIIYEWELPQSDQFQSTPQEKKGGWVWIIKSSSPNGADQGRGEIPTFIAFDLPNRLIYTSPEDTRLPYVRSFTQDGFVIQDQRTKAFEQIWYKDWQTKKF